MKLAVHMTLIWLKALRSPRKSIQSLGLYFAHAGGGGRLHGREQNKKESMTFMLKVGKRLIFKICDHYFGAAFMRKVWKKVKTEPSLRAAKNSHLS